MNEELREAIVVVSGSTAFLFGAGYLVCYLIVNF